MKSTLKVLPQGTTFEATVMVHNLKPEELGALIWAIQLGTERNASLAHNIGHGKPLGLGIVDIELSQVDLLTTQYEPLNDTKQCVDAFVSCMNEHYPSEKFAWEDSAQIKMLQSFADYQQNYDRKELQYMALNGDISYNKSSIGMLFEWKDKGFPVKKEETDLKLRLKGKVMGRLTQLLATEKVARYVPDAPKPPPVSEPFQGIPGFERLCVWLDNPELNYKNTRVGDLYEAITYFIESDIGDKSLGKLLIKQFDIPEIKKTLIPSNKKNRDKAKARKALFAQLQAQVMGNYDV